LKLGTSSARCEENRIYGAADYFLISFFEHGGAVEVKSKSREVRENWVRKPNGWDSIKLERCNIVLGLAYIRRERLTIGLRLKYWGTKRKTTTKNPATYDTFKV